MRLFIGCEERLGICAEILDILVKHSIDLRGIEIETPGGIFLNFPTVEFAEFQHLMPEIRLIRGVFDVSLVPYMPLERERTPPGIPCGTGRLELSSQKTKVRAGVSRPTAGGPGKKPTRV